MGKSGKWQVGGTVHKRKGICKGWRLERAGHTRSSLWLELRVQKGLWQEIRLGRYSGSDLIYSGGSLANVFI